MQSNRMVVGRDEMDRLIMMRMDVDRYENETIPALLQRIESLRRALLRYGCHKSSCEMTPQSDTGCTCGLEAAIEGSGLLN
jgi:hypothetical protein